MTHFSNINENSNELKFNLKNNNDIKLSLSNALRRIIISQIQTFAIDEETVIFNENTSMLHGSYLSKRLALLPIDYESIEDFDIENINISLNITNNDIFMINIYTKDFVVDYSGTTLDKFFINDNILFGKLKPNQTLNLQCKIKKSNADLSGAYHSSTCKAIVTFEQDDSMLETITKDMNEDVKQKYLNVVRETYYLKNERNEPLVYIFDIESIGMIKPKKIVETAINILKVRLENIQTALNENNDQKITVNENNKNFQSYDFTLIDENHTIGNLISSYLLDNPKISYSGYIIPHPNDNKLVITTSTKDNNTQKDNITVFLETVNYLIDLVDKLNNEWETANKIQAPVVKKIVIKKSK